MNEESKGGLRPWHVVVGLMFLFAVRELYGPGHSGVSAKRGKEVEIVGKDLAGADLKLSDFRGKVVMLDFWGHW